MIIFDHKVTTIPEECVASIGFFDGAHRGHRYLIDQIVTEATRRGLKSALVTFPIPPVKVIHPDREIELLSPICEKLDLLAQTPIDYCFLLDFTVELSKLSAQEFMKQVLKDKYNVKCLIIGYDHRFGHNRAEGFEEYQKYGAEMGIDVIQAKAFPTETEDISSSLIRASILSGDLEKASNLLGYPYQVKGSVIKGNQLGRTIGFPTANIKLLCPDKILPKNGVYAVEVLLENTEKPYWGMLNIGHRPTVEDNGHKSIEVNILNFKGDIYDQKINIIFHRRLRDEIKFPNLDGLVSQLHKDQEAVLAYSKS